MTTRVELNFKVPNQTSYLAMIGQMGETLAYSLKNFHGNRKELAYHLNLVLTEALTNAICHGNACDPEKYVTIDIAATDKTLVIKVIDQGQGFDITARDKIKAAPLDESGRGINIIMKLMDKVSCTREKGMNVLKMTKYLH